MMVKPRSLNVERSLRGSPRIENLKEEVVLESITRKCDSDGLKYTTALSWQCQLRVGSVAVRSCDRICRRLHRQHKREPEN